MARAPRKPRTKAQRSAEYKRSKARAIAEGFASERARKKARAENKAFSATAREDIARWNSRRGNGYDKAYNEMFVNKAKGLSKRTEQMRRYLVEQTGHMSVEEFDSAYAAV